MLGGAVGSVLITSMTSSRQRQLAVRIEAHQPLHMTGLVHKNRPVSAIVIRDVADSPGATNGGSSKMADTMKNRPHTCMSALSPSSPLRQRAFDRASSALIMTSA